MPKTVVVFRRWRNGDIMALFPFEPGQRENPASCMSYERVGQHGYADYSYCIKCSRAAKPLEYAALKRELEGLGYDLEVRNRKNGQRVIYA